MPPEHDTIENVRFWKAQTEGWFDKNVHGKTVDDVVGIAGQVVVELGDEWVESNAVAARDGLIDAGFPNVRIEGRRNGGNRLRFDATDDRLPVPYSGSY